MEVTKQKHFEVVLLNLFLVLLTINGLIMKKNTIFTNECLLGIHVV